MAATVGGEPVTDRIRYDGLVQPLPRDLFDEICPSALSPIRMGDKWTPLVLRCLEDGPRRFSELRVPMHRTSAKELTRSLRNLEREARPGLTPTPDPSSRRWTDDHSAA